MFSAPYKKLIITVAVVFLFSFGSTQFVRAAANCVYRFGISDTAMCKALNSKDSCKANFLCKWIACVGEKPGCDDSANTNTCVKLLGCSWTEDKLPVPIQAPNNGTCSGVDSADDTACQALSTQANCVANPLCKFSYCLAFDAAFQSVCNKTTKCESVQADDKNDTFICKWTVKIPPKPNTPNQPTSIGADQLQNQAAGLNQLKTFLPAGGSAQTAVQSFIGQGIKVLMAFIGSISLILYIYAGLLWMTAAGNAENLTKAKQIMVWTTFGVVMMFASYLIVNFVFGEVLGFAGGI